MFTLMYIARKVGMYLEHNRKKTSTSERKVNDAGGIAKMYGLPNKTYLLKGSVYLYFKKNKK